MPLNKLYGLCYLLPSIPSAESRHICYKPQRLIITSPQNQLDSEMCKSRSETCLMLAPPELSQTGEELWAPGEGWRETYHNYVFMLLGRQVCVLQDEAQKAGRKQKKQTNINKVEHLYPEGPRSFSLSVHCCCLLLITDQKPLRGLVGTGDKYPLGQGNQVLSPCPQPVSYLTQTHHF